MTARSPICPKCGTAMWEKSGALFCARQNCPYMVVKPTDGEMAVLRLLAEGLTIREIGTRMHFSERTVKNRLSALYDRLGAKNGTHAVAIAFRSGVLS